MRSVQKVRNKWISTSISKVNMRAKQVAQVMFKCLQMRMKTHRARKLNEEVCETVLSSDEQVGSGDADGIQSEGHCDASRRYKIII